MAELLPSDVQTYTNGRLLASDPAVQRMLDAALMVARRECKWHVSPVLTISCVLDGPDSRVLWLPSQKVTAVTALSEDGVALTLPDDISISQGNGPYDRRSTAARKTGGVFWSAEYGSIAITMSHGWTETEAVDWRNAILQMVDQMSQVPISAGSGTSSFGVKQERIDDVSMTYVDYGALAEAVLFSANSILCGYKLPDMEFI